MAETRWGRKHMCPDCETPFYDMRRQPITCPKCGAKHQPAVLLKSDGRPPRRNRLQPTLAKPPAVEATVSSIGSETAELDPEPDERAEEPEDEDIEAIEDENDDATLTEAEPSR